MHVHALMKGVGSMKRYRKEGSERRLRGDAALQIKLPPPELAAPLPRSPLPPGTVGEGGGGEGEGGRGGKKSEGWEREGRERGS